MVFFGINKVLSVVAVTVTLLDAIGSVMHAIPYHPCIW